jgi:hypothetical protein
MPPHHEQKKTITAMTTRKTTMASTRRVRSLPTEASQTTTRTAVEREETRRTTMRIGTRGWVDGEEGTTITERVRRGAGERCGVVRRRSAILCVRFSRSRRTAMGRKGVFPSLTRVDAKVMRGVIFARRNVVTMTATVVCKGEPFRRFSPSGAVEASSRGRGEGSRDETAGAFSSEGRSRARFPATGSSYGRLSSCAGQEHATPS